MDYNEPCSFLKHGIAVCWVDVRSATGFFGLVLRKLISRRIASLSADVFDQLLDLRCIHKSALKPNGFVPKADEHIPLADEPFGTACVHNGTGIDLRSHAKGDARREIGFDDAGDDIH
ncbi:MAG: Uncharacterised protein [Flavobacteriia bacterium]|nr:MAG: Uncharacterised protein [Flavobacteriia bacterium]